jgi:hypothetical protein
MIPLVALLAFLALAWRGAGLLALALLATGFLSTFLLSIRVLRASVGGVGGHAEWVRDVSVRPRLARSPVWAVGVGLIAAGTAIGLWETW